jgi:hypothetical protein
MLPRSAHTLGERDEITDPLRDSLAAHMAGA